MRWESMYRIMFRIKNKYLAKFLSSKMSNERWRMMDRFWRPGAHQGFLVSSVSSGNILGEKNGSCAKKNGSCAKKTVHARKKTNHARKEMIASTCCGSLCLFPLSGGKCGRGDFSSTFGGKMWKGRLLFHIFENAPWPLVDRVEIEIRILRPDHRSSYQTSGCCSFTEMGSVGQTRIPCVSLEFFHGQASSCKQGHGNSSRNRAEHSFGTLLAAFCKHSVVDAICILLSKRHSLARRDGWNANQYHSLLEYHFQRSHSTQRNNNLSKL